jgi:hypothetical protein
VSDIALVDNADRRRLDTVSAQEFYAIHDPAMCIAAPQIYSLSIVKVGRSVNAHADGEASLREELSPPPIDEDSIGLDRVGYPSPGGRRERRLYLTSSLKEPKSCQQWLTTVPRNTSDTWRPAVDLFEGAPQYCQRHYLTGLALIKRAVVAVATSKVTVLTHALDDRNQGLRVKNVHRGIP